MDWCMELRARLEDDARFTAGVSRAADVPAYFSDGKEVVRFSGAAQGSVSIRLGREGILLLGAVVGDPRLLEVAHDWLLVRVAEEADLAFVEQLLRRAIVENGPRKPRGRGLPAQRKRRGGA